MSDSPLLTIEHLFISPGHNFFGRYGKLPNKNPMTEVPEVHCLAGHGLEGDRFLDYKTDYKGQITFFAGEIYDELCARFDVRDKPPSAFRRNVITRGVDLNTLIKREFTVQGVPFLGTGECSPCQWMDTAFAPGTEAALQGRGGLRARILTDGVLRVG